MVRGCSAAVGNFTEVIHQPRRGRGKTRASGTRSSPPHSIPLYKTPKGETKCEET